MAIPDADVNNVRVCEYAESPCLPGSLDQTLPGYSTVMREHMAEQAAQAATTKALTPAVFAAIPNPIGLIFAAVITIALFPPKTGKATAGLLASCAMGFKYGGAFAIEYLGLQHYSLDAQDAVRMACAVPMWMVWQIAAVQLERWRKAKNPAQVIAGDIKKAKGE